MLAGPPAPHFAEAVLGLAEGETRGLNAGCGRRASRQCAVAAFWPDVGLSNSFCTRQFRISATYSVFSFGHAISWIQPNCLSCLPDSPSTPSTLPSSDSL